MTENLYTPNSIRTNSGIYMNVLEPTEDMINIEDIAHSLSQQPRFGGHLPNFYSVAQHSLNCSYLADDPKMKLCALLHDASEAYLLDIPSPIKSLIPKYKEMEDKLMAIIAKKFGFEYPLPEEIKIIDKSMLNQEWDELMLKQEMYIYTLKTCPIEDTKDTFLSMFDYYTTLINTQP